MRKKTNLNQNRDISLSDEPKPHMLGHLYRIPQKKIIENFCKMCLSCTHLFKKKREKKNIVKRPLCNEKVLS